MADHLLSVSIPEATYTQLVRRAQQTGVTPQSLVAQAVTAFLQPPELSPALSAYLESRLQEIKGELQAYIQAQQGQIVKPQPAPEPTEDIPPTIRPLQVGDIVQIRDPDSPFYLQKAVVVSTSLIRATVDTGRGKHTFLKRDIRFVSSNSHEPNQL